MTLPQIAAETSARAVPRAKLPWLVVRPPAADTAPATQQDKVAANLARLHSDRELLEQVKAADFTGPEYQQLHDDLWMHAWKVLRTLVRTGRILDIDIGFPHSVPNREEWDLLHGSAEVRDGLVIEAIASAVQPYMTRLRNEGWNPEKGASLRTHFIGFACRHFWHAFTRWAKKRRRDLAMLTDLQKLYRPSDSAEDPALRISQRAALRRILRSASTEQKAMAALLLRGMTHVEVAEALNMTTRQVEARMRALRAVGWRLVKKGSIDPLLIPGSRKSSRRALGGPQ
jgi:DNA-directed RNA polymerase specialized sigma24 family protein